MSVFISIPKTGSAKEWSNYRTVALISHTSKVMLKILQTRLQQCVSHELPDVQTVFRKDRGIRVKLPTYVGSWKSKRVPEKHLLLPEAGECVGFISYSPSWVDGSGYLPEAGHYVCLQKWPDEINPHLKSQKQIQQWEVNIGPSRWMLLLLTPVSVANSWLFLHSLSCAS